MEEKDLRRLSDCEILINKYYQEIKSYMKQVDLFDKDFLSKKEFFDRMKNQRDSFYKEIDGILEKNANLNSDFQGHIRKAEDHHKLLDKTISHQGHISVDVKNCLSYIDFLRNKNGELSHRIDSLSMRMPNRDKIQQDFNDMKMKFSSVYEDLQRQIDILRNVISQQDADLRMLHGKISNEKDVSIKRQSDTDSILSQLKNQINEVKSIHKSDKDDIIKYINNLPKPTEVELPNFDDMSEKIKKSVMDKAEEDSNKFLKALDISLLNEIEIKVINKKLNSILAVLEKNKFS
jgi:hypothetical protein